MRRFLPYTALALYLSVLPATAADRYGGWLLEQPRSSVFTLSFKQSVPRNGKIATSELGFICDQRDKSAHVGVLLIPVDGTFKNQQRIIPVLIQKNNDQYDPSDPLQHWKNGTEYIFLESNDNAGVPISRHRPCEAHRVCTRSSLRRYPRFARWLVPRPRYQFLRNQLHG